jgi:eukaryotic-like serine/threonine-protein kinase
MQPLDLSLYSGFSLLAQAGDLDIAESPGGGQFGAMLMGALLMLLLLVLVVGGVFAYRWWRAQTPAGAGPAGVGTGLDRDTRRRIEAARQRGEFESVGDLYNRHLQHTDAAEAYARAGAHIKAAKSFQSAGNRAQAIHHYKQGGDFKQAARLYEEDSQHRAAAAEYVVAGEFLRAGEQYALAADPRRAAEYFERAGEPLKASVYHEKAENPARAAELLVQHVEAQIKVQGGAELMGQDREYARKAATMLKASGDPERASIFFQRVGEFEAAAECLRTTGDYTRAAEMLVSANQPMLAARYFEEGGQPDRAALMRAEESLKAGDMEAAAREFRKGNKLERAAEIYEQMQRWESSAGLYEQVERFDKAGALYLKAEKPANAAHCAEQAGQLTRAAELFEQAGDFLGHVRILRKQGDLFRAGRLLYENRQFDDALAALDQIDSRDAMYLSSLELQGDVLRAQNRFEKAYSRYRAALGTRQADRGTIPLFYKMGRALEEIQDFTGAVQQYQTVHEVDANYEDVGQRMRAIRRGQRPGKTTTSGIFSSKEVGGAPRQRYEVIEEIARGGMGVVYRAQDTLLGRVVAFKVLGENLKDNQTAVEYFLREARASAALSHPNIVTVFDAGEQEGDYYIAMEFVEGTTLKELLRRHGALPEDQVRYIMIHCCRALHYAHSKGVIHRDIKSGNAMITRDKTLKIMDFGLAKFLTEYQNNHTQQVGTPFYMSPEQIIGKNIDFRSDLYSLGCTLFECATGTVPFFKGDLSYHHLHTKPPSPRSINPALTREMEAIILKLLEKDPDNRYQSARELIESVTAAASAPLT